jgi:hypothetical protein
VPLSSRLELETSTGKRVKLVAYVHDGWHVDIRPARVERAWMDATDQRFAYRCLPLNIANAFGWEILCPSGFTAAWDGGRGLESIQVHPEPGTAVPALSHFMHGILTFHVRCLFRTEPGYDLMVQGAGKLPEGWYCASLRRDRDRLGAISVHNELDVHAAGRGCPV